MKILALDLGQSSIGWLLRNDEKDGKEQFEKFGVITFEKGVGEEKNVEYSLAAERTKYRAMRRLYQARKYRLWATLKKLKAADYCPIEEESLISWSTYNKHRNLKRQYPVEDENLERWIRLDFNGDSKPDFISPYQLRKHLVEEKLDFENPQNRYMLGRALYHIAQHRAFKSSKKLSRDGETKEIQSEEEKKSEFLSILERAGIEVASDKTVGQLLAEAELKLHEASGNEELFRSLPFKRIRNELHPLVTRKLLILEVEKIFQFQFGENWENIFEKIFGTRSVAKSVIFWQRPLRSQKGLVGKCILERKKPRCPKSRPEFEIFRAWQVLNNLRYRVSNGSWLKLPLEIKESLFKNLFISANPISYADIKKHIEQTLQVNGIILNYELQKEIPGCPSIFYLSKILGEEWQNCKIEREPAIRLKKTSTGYERYESSKNYYSWEDLWHVVFQNDDQDEVKRIAKEKFRLDDEQLKYYLKWFDELEDGYASLSLNAIKKINYFLNKGWEYDKAVLLANIPYILGKQVYEQNESSILLALSTLFEEYQKDVHVVDIANAMISDFALKNNGHLPSILKFNESDIELFCRNHFGEKTWMNFTSDIHDYYIKKVAEKLSSYQSSLHPYFTKPALSTLVKEFLQTHFDVSEKKLKKIYHHAQGEIYPAVQPEKDGKCYLQSPKTGYWRNPMALKVLQELRQLVNYLIRTDQVDKNTRVVVEIPRELNDANRRKAYQIWQERREKENIEFAKVLEELIKNHSNLKANPSNDTDIDKFRLWYEQCFSLIEEYVGDEKPNEKITYTSKSRRKTNDESEKNFELWKENFYEKIRSSIWFKKDNDRYKLWKEQQAICLYTGKFISLTDLFSEDKIDIEHTIPYSLSFDNSLANKTVCYKDYNRNIKKNRIPAQCPNYAEILDRIKPWEKKIEEIKMHLTYWENQSKRARDITRKNQCIVQKHLWRMELEYWTNKVNRFKMQEIPAGFVNAQLTETQMISKYAFHYLRTVFDDVRVQKGLVTAEFAKIIGLRDYDNPKNRDKHTHHVKDALVLSLIPGSQLLKEILHVHGKLMELKKEYNYLMAYMQKGPDVNQSLQSLDKEINNYDHKLKTLLKSAQIPDSNILNTVANQVIENQTLALNTVRHKIFVTTKKRIHKGSLKGKYQTGDTVRGQLHKETFYGKIKAPIKTSSDAPNQELDHEFWIVKREPVTRDLDIEKIVDLGLKRIFEEEIKKIKAKLVEEKVEKNEEKLNEEAQKKLLEKAEKEGGFIYTDPNSGKTIRIRHVRCKQRLENPIILKKQTYPSKHEYKNWYYVDNAENIYYALYETQSGRRTFEVLTLYEATKRKKQNAIKCIEDFFPSFKVLRNKEKAYLKAILYPGLKVIFYENSIKELFSLEKELLNKRIYTVFRLFSSNDGRIIFKHHLEARDYKKILSAMGTKTPFSTIDFSDLKPMYLLSVNKFNFLVENKDFQILKDGEIIWNSHII